MKNYRDLGGCYPPRPTASTDNTLLDLRIILHSGAPARAKRAWDRAPYPWNMVNLSGRKNVLRKLLRIPYRRLKAGFSVC